MILIVVLSLLTLFAIVGISFVLVSDSMALSSRIAAQSETTFKPDLDPEGSFAFFLGQLVYDVEDTGPSANVYSGMRGHSLARSTYGYNDANMALNDKAFSGVGRPRIPGPIAGATGPGQYLGYLVNHTYYPADGFLLDPEQTTWRTGPTAAKTPGTYLPVNVPYTYPDHNNFFLASANFVPNPTTGVPEYRVIVPSFHRPWLFGKLDDPTNANWTTPWGKYLTPRPRPAEMGPGFPFPEDAGGDVKNLINLPGGNDSIWIDLGAPVMTSADGRKYKMLFAPLILDMDNRINLNVHGNIRVPGGIHASGQGWGPWEVNPSKVLNLGTNEMQQLLSGAPAAAPPVRVMGRYGPDQQPGIGGNSAGGGTTPRGWAQVDFDGYDPATAAITQRFLLPGEPGTVNYQPYPTFATGYGNGSPQERLNHMLLYNPFRQNLDDNRSFPPSSLAAILRKGDTGGQGLSSDLFLLLEKNLVETGPNDPNLARIRINRALVTTHSSDLDRPGAVPYVWNRALGDPSAYTWSAANGYPVGATPITTPFNSIPTNRSLTPAGSEFDPVSWRSQLSSVLRVNLNRSLQRYPNPDPTTGQIAAVDMPTYNAAYADRILLAQDIFDRLWRVTGAQDPTTVAYGTDDFRTLRWLAQLAVNIVDFVDEDDIITVWQWYPLPGMAGGNPDIVYGTEQPNLLLNEVYAQLDNLATDVGIKGAAVGMRKATDGFSVGVYAELMNPRIAENINGVVRDNIARLALGTPAQPVYQIVLAGYDNATKGPAVLADPDNTAGNPQTATITPLRTSTVDWTPAGVLNTVNPLNNQFSDATSTNNGFYCLGADATFLVDAADPNVKPADPTLTTVYQTANMRVKILATENPAQFFTTVFLRRLAVPTLPPGPNNPYITVDAFHTGTMAQTNDARSYDGAGVNAGFVAVPARKALGRFQPFGASQTLPQAPMPAPANSAQNTFYRQNSIESTLPIDFTNPNQTLKTFDWLAHLDRQVVSPIELLNVSAWKPSQLTDKFVQGGLPHQHTAKWFDPNTRLARFLEFVQVRPTSTGVAMGDRIPGRININTMNHLDVFRALCDGQDGITGNRFSDAQVTALYNKLIAYRGATPGVNSTDPVLSSPNPQERPFWSLAVGSSPGGDQWTGGTRGLENTLLAPSIVGAGPATPRLLDPLNGTGHPYQNMELLNKIFNNVTTRSNVFAVWLTVGYFEVPDAASEAARPVQLGAEIGRAEGRHIRHRFFALIDRTKMVGFTNAIMTFKNPVAPQPGVPTYIQFPVASIPIPNTTPAKTWTIQPGTILTLNPDTDIAETVAVEADPDPANPGGLRALVRLPYTTPVPVTVRGNPGPWTRYNPKRDPCVLYFAPVD
jgi:hypothetical protein